MYEHGLVVSIVAANSLATYLVVYVFAGDILVVLLATSMSRHVIFKRLSWVQVALLVRLMRFLVTARLVYLAPCTWSLLGTGTWLVLALFAATMALCLCSYCLLSSHGKRLSC